MKIKTALLLVTLFLTISINASVHTPPAKRKYSDPEVACITKKIKNDLKISNASSIKKRRRNSDPTIKSIAKITKLTSDLNNLSATKRKNSNDQNDQLDSITKKIKKGLIINLDESEQHDKNYQLLLKKIQSNINNKSFFENVIKKTESSLSKTKNEYAKFLYNDAITYCTCIISAKNMVEKLKLTKQAETLLFNLVQLPEQQA